MECYILEEQGGRHVPGAINHEENQRSYTLKQEVDLSNRAIAGACNISNSTVREYLRWAETAGISWPLGGISESELYQKLFGEPIPRPEITSKPLPDWEEVSKELRQKGVTLQLIWMEYIEKHNLE